MARTARIRPSAERRARRGKGMMGMYTEFHFNVKLADNVPAEVLAILTTMLDTKDPDALPALPDHPLFQSHLWRWMLLCDSYYFEAEVASSLTFDDNGDDWRLCVRCNLKNYGGEIEHFVDWITPYIDAQQGDFLGFSRYEENEIPTLIYHPNKMFKPVVPKDITSDGW
jgi:hypothetical protein